jgi:hypothetical protein
MSEGFPSKLRNRELTGKLLQYTLDFSTNPKLWDLILPRDLKKWDTEGALIYALWEGRFHHRSTIDEPQCKQGDPTRVHNTCCIANSTTGSL